MYCHRRVSRIFCWPELPTMFADHETPDVASEQTLRAFIPNISHLRKYAGPRSAQEMYCRWPVYTYARTCRSRWFTLACTAFARGEDLESFISKTDMTTAYFALAWVLKGWLVRMMTVGCPRGFLPFTMSANEWRWPGSLSGRPLPNYVLHARF